MVTVTFILNNNDINIFNKIMLSNNNTNGFHNAFILGIVLTKKHVFKTKMTLISFNILVQKKN